MQEIIVNPCNTKCIQFINQFNKQLSKHCNHNENHVIQLLVKIGDCLGKSFVKNGWKCYCCTNYNLKIWVNSTSKIPYKCHVCNITFEYSITRMLLGKDYWRKSEKFFKYFIYQEINKNDNQNKKDQLKNIFDTFYLQQKPQLSYEWINSKSDKELKAFLEEKCPTQKKGPRKVIFNLIQKTIKSIEKRINNVDFYKIILNEIDEDSILYEFDDKKR